MVQRGPPSTPLGLRILASPWILSCRHVDRILLPKTANLYWIFYLPDRVHSVVFAIFVSLHYISMELFMPSYPGPSNLSESRPSTPGYPIP